MSGSPASFESEHRRLAELLQRHLLAVVGGEFGQAQGQFEHWQAALARHLQIEEDALLPRVPAGARWPARVYLLEHQRIRELAREYGERVARLAAQPLPAPGLPQRSAALALLDSAHALRHLIEHHHQREEMALAHELPQSLQEQAWRG